MMTKFLISFIFAITMTHMSSAQVLPNFKKAEQSKQKTETTNPSSLKKVESGYSNKSKKKKITNGYVENYPWEDNSYDSFYHAYYTGDIRNGLPNGKGKSYDNYNTVRYIGNFIDGKYSNGTEYFLGYKVFEGTYDEKGDRSYGKEYQYQSDKIRYEGGFKNGYYNGMGKFYLSGDISSIQEGEFVNNYLKKGTYTTPEYKYEGIFDHLFLEGTIYFQDGNKYIGKLQDLKYSTSKGSTGIYYFTNGDNYNGEFNKQVPNGHGIYTWASGSKYTGSFESGQINGRGELFNGSTTYRGTFKTLQDGRLNFDEEGTKKHLTFSKSDGSVPFPIQKPKIYSLWW